MWDEEWQGVRNAVLTRDGNACRVCSAHADDVGTHRLHAHHIRPRADGGPDDPGNCVTLCEDCHAAKHGGRTSYLDVEFVQTVHGRGPLTTGEVADWMGCSRTTARRRLSDLDEQGTVVSVDAEDGTAWRAPRSLAGRVLDALNPFA